MDFNELKLLNFWESLEVGIGRINVAGGGGGEYGQPAHPAMSEGRSIDYATGIHGVALSFQFKGNGVPRSRIVMTAINDGDAPRDCFLVEVGDGDDIDERTNAWLVEVWAEIVETFRLSGRGDTFLACSAPFIAQTLAVRDPELATAIFG